MRGDQDDALPGHPRTTSPGLRGAGLAVGFLLAVAATVVVFLTDDPEVLRLAVVGAAWAFVLAALATTRRRGGEVADRGDLAAVEREAAEREAELRLAYELELEREVAARREVELRAENDVRRETEQAVRSELDALRGELSRVAELRREMTQVAELRRDIAQIADLRRDLGQVAELRRDVAALGELRAGLSQLGDLRGDLAQLAELRADVGRLRTELTEQLSGEMLVERIMLRTQSSRSVAGPGEAPSTRTIDAVGWSEPAAELTAARPAPRPEELPDGRTRQMEGVRAEQPAVTATSAAATPPPPPMDWLAERALVAPEEADSARRSRHGAAEDPPQPPTGAHAPEAEPRRRRTDEPYHRPPVPADQLTQQRPAVRPERPAAPGPAWSAAPTGPEGPPEGASRLAEILAQNGVTPSAGGRRRRRYREDGDSDDVLSRVLGRTD
ncbi:DUF6779 domain-containing protein [Geodermatophilus sp. SYSU D00742]